MKNRLSNNLKTFRIYCELTQKQVADYLNIDRGVYAAFESGEKIPSDGMLEDLACLYNLSVSDLQFDIDIYTKLHISAPDLQEIYDNLYKKKLEVQQINLLSPEEKNLIFLYRMCIKKDLVYNYLRDLVYYQHEDEDEKEMTFKFDK